MLSSAVAALLIAAAPAFAQERQDDAEIPMAERIVVTGEIIYRNRTEDTAPVLEYGQDYFQPFEPLSVGDALKRVPGVAFTSDVLEYDAVQLRGLTAGYTQILINGEKVPGQGTDRGFFVDRIPAELIEGIEIIRSPSADVPSEGIGGTLNILLKDDVSLQGGFARVSGLWYENDGKATGSAAAAWAGDIGGSRLWVAGNVQGRRNPKTKVTDFYDGSFVYDNETEFQDDVRDGIDYSANAEWTLPINEDADFTLKGFYVRTNRDEDETSILAEFTGGGFDPLELETQAERIEQDNYGGEAELEWRGARGVFEAEIGYAAFIDDITETTTSNDFGDPLEPDEKELTDTTDREISNTFSYEFEATELTQIKVGVDLLDKDRDASLRTFEWDDGTLTFEEETPDGNIYVIEETRFDPFVKTEIEMTDHITLELGVRYELTWSDIESTNVNDPTDPADDVTTSLDNEYDFLNPSAHLKIDLTEVDRVRASVARTVRRPDFDQIGPATIEEEPTDEDDTVGNPELVPETAWGFDVGYERRLGALGIFGVNAFYRDIQNFIELSSTGLPASGGGLVYTYENVSDATAWGLEFDLSTPLEFMGLPDTGFFANYAFLDSRIVDPILLIERRIRDQPDYVYNVGFIHNLRDWAAAFGVTYQERGDSTQYSLGEIRTISYDGDLELFLEKRFGDDIVFRLTAGNLLDAEKREEIISYETRADMIANNVDGVEYEREESGPVVQLVARKAF